MNIEEAMGYLSRVSVIDEWTAHCLMENILKYVNSNANDAQTKRTMLAEIVGDAIELSPEDIKEIVGVDLLPDIQATEELNNLLGGDIIDIFGNNNIGVCDVETDGADASTILLVRAIKYDTDMPLDFYCGVDFSVQYADLYDKTPDERLNIVQTAFCEALGEAIEEIREDFPNEIMMKMDRFYAELTDYINCRNAEKYDIIGEKE